MKKTLRIATLNILFDHRKKHILFSKERYKHILELTHNLNVDVIGFTEVLLLYKQTGYKKIFKIP
jgi:hypothetical protein